MTAFADPRPKVGFGSLAFAGPAQQISGQILDRTTGEPVAGAIIYVETLQRQFQTDEDGAFVLKIEQPDIYTILVTRVGYDTDTRTIDLRSEYPSPLVIPLSARPVSIEEILITDKKGRLTLEHDVYEREIAESSP